MNRDDLIRFEDTVAEMFNRGELPFPIHLSDGNEDGVIEAFETINENDWVCGSWRMHYQCLMHGVSVDDMMRALIRGESISLCFPERRIVSSAIVGGILPIAVGIAMSIQRRSGSELVHCWLGDMTARTGIFHECRQFARGHDLPIRWIVEDNQISVCTPTSAAWGVIESNISVVRDDIFRYSYTSKYPHAGAGVRIQF